MRGFWAIIIAVVGTIEVFGSEDPHLVLSDASASGNEFQFTVNGETGVSYSVETSTNFFDWLPVGTNDGPGAARVITITNPPDGQGFYRVSRKSIPLFRFALAATGTIALGGGSVDSYDSSVGPYNVFTNRNANGNIATDSTGSPAVSIVTGHVFGTVATGPGGTISISGGSAVGDVAWNTNGNIGVEGTEWTNNNMNIAFPTNTPPPGPFLTPTATAVGGSNATFLATGQYMASSFTSSNSSQPLIVTGNAILYVTGPFMVSGTGYVQIRPGASLILYAGDNTTTISGGGVANSTGLAANFSYCGLNSNTSFIYSGSSALIGTINAPQASVALSGGGSWFGAGIAQSIALTSGVSMHFDESGPTR